MRRSTVTSQDNVDSLGEEFEVKYIDPTLLPQRAIDSRVTVKMDPKWIFAFCPIPVALLLPWAPALQGKQVYGVFTYDNGLHAPQMPSRAACGRNNNLIGGRQRPLNAVLTPHPARQGPSCRCTVDIGIYGSLAEPQVPSARPGWAALCAFPPPLHHPRH